MVGIVLTIHFLIFLAISPVTYADNVSRLFPLTLPNTVVTS